jgi:WD40 repeat protein
VDTTQVLIVNSATEKPFTMKSKTYCETVAWISHNQLASGYHDGTVEIHEIGSHNRQMKSQVFQKIRHDLGDDGRDRTIFSPFEFPTLHGQTQSAVLSIAFTRNEELDIFASGGSDRRVKVFKQTCF